MQTWREQYVSQRPCLKNFATWRTVRMFPLIIWYFSAVHMHWKNMGDGIREKQHKIHKRYGHEASGGSQAWSVEECFAFDHAAARTPEAFLNGEFCNYINVHFGRDVLLREQ